MEKKDKSSPIKNKEDVPKNPDPHIDQDFPGYPHSPAKEKVIKPETKTDHKVAGTILNGKETPQKEIESDGSANAFDRTESVTDENEDQGNDESGGY